MAVRIRLKKMGRRHRPFYRVCAMDARAARDGRVIEELGFYDPMVRETDARAVLNRDRIDYWLSVGALPTEKVAVLIKKYGTNGSHVEQQQSALERLKASRPTAPPPVKVPAAEPEPPAAEAESAPAEGAQEEAAADGEASEQPVAAGETEAGGEEAKESSE